MSVRKHKCLSVAQKKEIIHKVATGEKQKDVALCTYFTFFTYE